MSFDQEWVSVRSASTATVSTRLNQVEPSGGGGGGGSTDLSVSQDKLGALGSAAHKLHGHLSGDGKHADASTTEAATTMTVNGFQTGAAITTVQKTWTSQLKTLLDACAHISNHLDYSSASHANEEKDIETAFRTSQITEFLK
ncbi:hypothetical protein [Streptomyces albipurpureus]|uniref:AG1 protein n=1 Tax=Streptomyces albipurpureus TaxID=2897419 RepID=A0ABT0UUN4_9ACTN|nr:hypothetical protein [Streptomyces sp. CWNU-1]MCM2392272.1 hypothetical protein [Streptomyces sp. CWNU-1]